MSPTASCLQLLVDASVTWYAAVGMQACPDEAMRIAHWPRICSIPERLLWPRPTGCSGEKMINQVRVGVCFAPGVEMAPVCKQRRSRMSGANSSNEAAVRQPRLCAISCDCAQLRGLRIQLYAACVQPVGSFAWEAGGMLLINEKHPILILVVKQTASMLLSISHIWGC